MTKTWILVADAKTAQIYTKKLIEKRIPMAGNATHPHFEETQEIEFVPVLAKALHSESAVIYQVGRNQTGAVIESVGGIRHMGEPHIDARREVKQHFAQAIADLLNHQSTEQEFDNLVLIAPSAMLSDIENGLNKKLHSKVSKKIAKELANLNIKELTEHLKNIN